MSKIFLLRAFYNTVKVTGKIKVGTTYQNYNQNIVEPHEFIFELPDNFSKYLSYAVNQLCFSLKQVTDRDVMYVSVWRVNEGEAINLQSNVTIFVQSVAYKQSNVFHGAPNYLRSIKTANGMNVYTQFGSTYHDLVYTNSNETIVNQMWQFPGNQTDILKNNFIEMREGSNRNTYIEFVNNSTKGTFYHWLLPYQFNTTDMRYIGNNKFELFAHGNFGRWRWKRYKTAMTLLLPLMGNYKFDRDGILRKTEKRTGRMLPKGAQWSRAKDRRKCEQRFGNVAMSQAIHSQLRQYTVYLGQLVITCAGKNHDTYWDTWNFVAMRSCWQAMENLYRLIASALGFATSYQSDTGQYSVNNGYPDMIQPAYNFADYSAMTEALSVIQEYLNAMLYYYPNQGTTNKSVGLNVNPNGYKYDVTYRPVSFTSKALFQQNLAKVEERQATLRACIPSLAKACFGFLRVYAYIEKTFQAIPLTSVERAKVATLDTKTSVPYLTGYANTSSTAPLVTWTGTGTPPTLVEATKSLKNVSFDDVPQSANRVPDGNKKWFYYAYIDYSIPSFNHSNFTWTDDEPDEPDEEEIPEREWHNVIDPLDPDEQAAENQSLAEEIATNLGYVADGALLASLPFTDGVLIPEEVAIKDGIGYLVDGAVKTLL